MHKKLDIGRLSLVCAVLIVLVVAVVLWSSLQRTSYVTLPTDTTTELEVDSSEQSDTAINAIAIAPDTVQAVIATLSRSDYRHTIRIEQFWSGGSGTQEMTVTQIGDLQRIDLTLYDGRIQHTITSPSTYYLWMDDAPPVYQSPMGAFTADETQGIPSYEDVLALSKSHIAQASYESLSGVRCIYVETTQDDDGYVNRYWVSVDTGLLMAAERLENDTTIYRMAVLTQETVGSVETYFVLPGAQEAVS